MEWRTAKRLASAFGAHAERRARLIVKPGPSLLCRDQPGGPRFFLDPEGAGGTGLATDTVEPVPIRAQPLTGPARESLEPSSSFRGHNIKKKPNRWRSVGFLSDRSVNGFGHRVENSRTHPLDAKDAFWAAERGQADDMCSRRRLGGV